MCANFSHSSFSGTPCCNADGHGAGEAVHQAADGRAFLGHGDEDLARHAVLVEADGEVAFVSAHGELVGDRQALLGQTMTARVGRRRTLRRRGSAAACPGSSRFCTGWDVFRIRASPSPSPWS